MGCYHTDNGIHPNDGPSCLSCQNEELRAQLKEAQDQVAIHQQGENEVRAKLVKCRAEVGRWKRDFLHYAQHDRRCECAPPCHLYEPK